MKHLMIDLETMGQRFDAPVLAVGAVFYAPETGELGKQFYGGVDMADACKFGKPNGDTIRWWLGQSEAARQAIIKGKHPLELVLTKFRDFALQFGDDVQVWGNGATFDISILEYAFPRCLNEAAPWKFWNVRDCRTIKWAAQGLDARETKLIGTAHNALDDAMHQARWVSAMYRKLRGIKSLPATEASDDLVG